MQVYFKVLILKRSAGSKRIIIYNNEYINPRYILICLRITYTPKNGNRGYALYVALALSS